MNENQLFNLPNWAVEALEGYGYMFESTHRVGKVQGVFFTGPKGRVWSMRLNLTTQKVWFKSSFGMADTFEEALGLL